MKKILPLLLVLALLASPALADPLTLRDDLAEKISEPINPDDLSEGVFSFSYRYPYVDEKAEGGANINQFYADLINEQEFYIEIARDAFFGESRTDITYTVTCNNDDYFSVLIRKEEINPDMTRVSWTGNVFSRKHGANGKSYSLPKLLGILDPDENDETIQDYKTEKVDKTIRDMIWNMIEENESGIDYGDLTEEALSHIFFPEEDFYLDDNGEPVFYLQPVDVYYDEVPDGTELLIFPITMEEIQDEL